MSVSTGEKPRTAFTILISDDENAVRRSMQLMLCACGYSVRSYASGNALIADPQALSADCLVVDYRMPDVDGFSVLQELRAKGWEGKALMVTAYCDHALETRARTAGFEEVVAKPFVARAIIDAVARFAKGAD